MSASVAPPSRWTRSLGLAATVASWLVAASCANPETGSATPSGTGGTGGTGTGGTGGAGAGGASGTGAAGGGGPAAPPTVILPRTSLVAAEVAVLVNTDDPQSVAVGEHYRVARGIPDAHVVSLALGADLGTAISGDVFTNWKTQIDAAVDETVQAFAVTWTKPSVVGCMSLTSALAFGVDPKWCHEVKNEADCAATAKSPYFDAATFTPSTKYGMRPAMMLPGVTTADAIALIDRGVAADGTFPTGDAWLLRTHDALRSVRYPEFVQSAEDWSHADVLALTYLDRSGGGSDFLTGSHGVLFYLTGLAEVPSIATNDYRPGAIADHLTSLGGMIPQSPQMSILRWLEAGATASYGTVVEPCAFTQKFSDSTVLIPHYYRGETVLEAYWKSVAWPGEGLFIGEPLAKPWGTKTSFADGTLTITTTTMIPGVMYSIESAPAANGPWTPVQTAISIPFHQAKTLTVTPATAPFYRFGKS